MPAKIIVAYRTRLVPALLPSAESLIPPSNYKDPAKIALWQEEAAAGLSDKCLYQPYLSTFDEIQMVVHQVPAVEKPSIMFKNIEGKQSIAVRARAWILKQFPNAWPHTTHPVYTKAPECIFVGFNPKLFLKMLGIECSLPGNQPADTTKLQVLPLSMWYGNTDHRDIGEAVMPETYKQLTWDIVLKARGMRVRFKDWKEPHVDVSADMQIITELASQIGLFAETM